MTTRTCFSHSHHTAPYQAGFPCTRSKFTLRKRPQRQTHHHVGGGGGSSSSCCCSDSAGWLGRFGPTPISRGRRSCRRQCSARRRRTFPPISARPSSPSIANR